MDEQQGRQHVEGASGGHGGVVAVDGPARVIKPQEVLESLMNDGTFDSLRAKVTAQLKSNEDLKQYTQSLVENSQALNSPGAENKSRRELFDSLRRELEGPVLDRASKAAWELILSKDNLGKEIADSVVSTYNKLSSQAEATQTEPSRDRTHAENTERVDHLLTADRRSTPSQERHDHHWSRTDHSKVNGHGQNGRDSGHVGSKREREHREDREYSRDRDRDRDRDREYFRDRDRDRLEKPRNRDKDLNERRDAAREREYYDGRRYERDHHYRDYDNKRVRS